MDWISVNEKMPEDNQVVLAYTPCDGYMFVGYHITNKYNDWDWSHWMIYTANKTHSIADAIGVVIRPEKQIEDAINTLM